MQVRVYSEDGFETKLRRERRLYGRLGDLDVDLLVPSFFSPDTVELQIRELSAILRVAKLPPNQGRIFGFRLSGCSYREIAVITDTSKQNCQQLFSRSQIKLQRAVRQYADFGVTDVYRDLVTRRQGATKHEILKILTSSRL